MAREARPLCPECGRPMVRWLGLTTTDWKTGRTCFWYRCPRCRLQLCLEYLAREPLYGFKEVEPEWPTPEA